MKIRHLGQLTIVLAAATNSVTSHGSNETGPLADSLQIAVVTTDSWDDTSGTLHRFERISDSEQWTPIGRSLSVVVGRKGLGWGLGKHSSSGQEGPTKREGDGKAPAGVFDVSFAFGFSDKSNGQARFALPYYPLTPSSECVDDVSSTYYNKVLERVDVRFPDWSSSEKMSQEPLYKWGAYINHNAPLVQAGSGSCIFFHIWKGPQSTTSGCTAMAEDALIELLAWLTPDKKPRLVQLPESAYLHLQKKWKLPEIEN